MFERFFNALLIFILSFVLLAGFFVQIVWQERPCPLCYLQRLGMLGVMCGPLLNLRFGVRTRHYALSFLFIFFGGFVALRQIALHVCPGFPTFGAPVLGVSLYTWSFIVFICSFLYLTFCLFLYTRNYAEPTHMPLWGYVALYLPLFLALGNVLTTFWECGLGACT